LADALGECERLRTENQQLRERLGLPQSEAADQSTNSGIEFNTTAAMVTSKSSADEKVKLFRSLFRGREDVYAVRWEGRNGKTGYSPAHRKIWSNSFQKRPDEPKEYFLLTDQVIHDHLTGKLTAGVYPLLTDETCWFLAADFDKTTWQDDVRASLQTCADWNIPALVTLRNPGASLAFFVRLRVLKSPDGEQILPSMWSDNYVSLLPGETRTLTARWRPEDAPGASPTVAVDGWNVLRK
jgi:hypothetical protein